MARASTDGWATLTIDVRTGPVDVEQLVEITRQLDEVAALLALRDDVSGVQTFDAAQSETQRPRLRVFTVPSALARVQDRAGSLLRAFGLTARLRPATHDDEQWREAWKRFYRPLVFGEHQLLLRPSWIERGPDDPRCEVVLDPGNAFGTGLHQSTQLCLDELCRIARAGATPNRMLDLGCGSGVLCLAAAKLFGSLQRIVAVDVDPDATATAAHNAARNGLSDRIEVVTGDGASLVFKGPFKKAPRSGDKSPTLTPNGAETALLGSEAIAWKTGQSLEPAFDLVTANIRPKVLVPLAPRLRALVHSGARVTLSGILGEEIDDVQDAWLAQGFVLGPRPRHERDTWSALHLLAP